MKRLFIAGNWKMNLNREQAINLAHDIACRARQFPHVDLAIFPPAVYLEAVRHTSVVSEIGLGAQNMSHEESGAFTGEISAAMLIDMGCRYVILGHSERRRIGETSEQINLKVRAALKARLNPIVCLGEVLSERNSGHTQDVLLKQFEVSLAGISDTQMSETVIAYEPIWAIGTGKVATPEQAQEVHFYLRGLIQVRYGAALARKVKIQYGGSVKPDNAAALLSQPDIDGALVGGASLNAKDFLAIASAAETIADHKNRRKGIAA